MYQQCRSTRRYNKKLQNKKQYYKSKRRDQKFQFIADIIDIDNTFAIKSASVAQVYRARLKNTGRLVALKVTHPELQYQIVVPKMYYNLYTRIVNTSSIFNNIKINTIKMII